VQTEFDKENAQFSPDTRWVAYDSAESGRSEIYVQSFPDPVTRFQVSTGGGFRPRWARDGEELFYLALDSKLMAVKVKTGPALRAGAPDALFAIPLVGPLDANGDAIAFDVSANGLRFLIRSRVRESTRSPITVVLNWTSTLKK
jgi:hypothetical protein